MGLPKPWITPYADERHEGAFAYDRIKQRIFFPPSTGVEEDRTLDVLWQPAPDRPTGQIFWREMHTVRQRQAMLERLCQVCGKPIETASTPWLIPDIEVQVRRIRPGRPFMTNTPPTCKDCISVASGLCPVLSAHPGTEYEVAHFRLWGVFGDYVGHDGRLHQSDLQFGHSLMSRMMARHLLVEIFDFRKARR